MVRRMTPAQYNAWVRQENARRKRAINAYNAEVKRVNAHNERVLRDYNRKVHTHNRKVVEDHNRRVRANNHRLRKEIAKLNATTSVRHTTLRRSVVSLTESFNRLEAEAESDHWSGSEELFDLSESETANSVGALNALLAEPSDNPATAEEITALRATSITDELSAIEPDLDARWRGALFSLHPENPDASRHFCTSARELLSSFLEVVAPDEDVLAADPNCQLTPNGSVSRRARVRHCLIRQGAHNPEMESFVEGDLNNVVSLFEEFNAGTHGHAGRFDLVALLAIKDRVEGAIKFVARVARPPGAITV